MLHPRGGPCYLLGALFRDKGVSQVLVYLHASSCVRFRLFGSQIPSVLTPPSHRCGECLLESSDRRVCIRVNPLVCFVIQEGLPAIVSHVEAELPLIVADVGPLPLDHNSMKTNCHDNAPYFGALVSAVEPRSRYCLN